MDIKYINETNYKKLSDYITYILENLLNHVFNNNNITDISTLSILEYIKAAKLQLEQNNNFDFSDLYDACSNLLISYEKMNENIIDRLYEFIKIYPEQEYPLSEDSPSEDSPCEDNSEDNSEDNGSGNSEESSSEDDNNQDAEFSVSDTEESD